MRRRRWVLTASMLVASVPTGSDTATASVPHHRIVIGHSVQGRPIRATEIGAPNAPHTVLVVGVIHGNEGAGLAVIDRLLRMTPPRGVDVWVVKLMNPDGYYANTRQNARGVDLNRNFPWKWHHAGSPWGVYYSGPSAASEPETRTAIRFIRDIRPEITIWYHQHEDEVIEAGGRIDIQRRYARLVHMHFERHYPWAPGRATNWENHRVRPSTAFAVELPAGRLSAATARQHARAVLNVAGML
jgi:murein peptide amidase A